jgi:hypothetical protein
MNNALQSNLIRSTGIIPAAGKILLGLILAAGSTASVRGQGEIASGLISSSGSGPFSYSLSFSDASGATSPIGSVWYGWTTSGFFLPGVPTGASAPAGWTALVDGTSVQYSANSPANDILAGHSLSGFGYTATFSPAQLAAAPNSEMSEAYSAGFFSDAGNIFTVQVSPVPEPSTLTLLVGGATGLFLAGRRRLRLRAG